MPSTLAEEHFGVERGFEVVLHKARLGCAFLLVVAEKTREPLRAAMVARPRGRKLVGLENAKRWGLEEGCRRGMLWGGGLKGLSDGKKGFIATLDKTGMRRRPHFVEPFDDPHKRRSFGNVCN